MKKLREVILQYDKWKTITFYVDRIEAYVGPDFSLSVENSKALLEAIAKEICSKKEVELHKSMSINTILKKSFKALGYTNNTLVKQISGSLANIGQQIGELRNEIGLTSHGRTLEDIEKRNDKVNKFTREFLIAATDLIASFLIENFQMIAPVNSVQQTKPIIIYGDNNDFNEFWDQNFGEFSMKGYSYSASEILYHVDFQAYQSECNVFKLENDERLNDD